MTSSSLHHLSILPPTYRHHGTILSPPRHRCRSTRWLTDHPPNNCLIAIPSSPNHYLVIALTSPQQQILTTFTRYGQLSHHQFDITISQLHHHRVISMLLQSCVSVTPKSIPSPFQVATISSPCHHHIIVITMIILTIVTSPSTEHNRQEPTQEPTRHCEQEPTRHCAMSSTPCNSFLQSCLPHLRTSIIQT